jgi:hypothetical protein
MRYFEITSGVRLPISSEEQTIIDKATTARLYRSTLDERDQEVARQMVTRGLLVRRTDAEKKVFFRLNKQKLERD